jgi:anti-sigma regulatory factor (Ser/Thr protein kinase)
MNFKRIKFIIESNLENVPLVGLAVNKLCSLISLSDTESYQIELCAVEAVTNCIKHAYGNRPGNEVEIIFTLYPERLTLEVCDTGIPMDQKTISKKSVSSLEVADNLTNIPESGRGLDIIKRIMDRVIYKTKDGKNCLLMIKEIS